MTTQRSVRRVADVRTRPCHRAACSGVRRASPAARPAAIAICVLACLATACSKSERSVGSSGEKSGSGQTGTGGTAAALPAGLFGAPTGTEGAKSVKEVKASAKAGERVTIRGRVGGSVSPFVDGLAVLTVVDVGVKSCADGAQGHCPTPWDYCCEPRDVLSANSATVRVVGTDGRPIRASLKGAGPGGTGAGQSAALKELDVVVVAGTVSAQSAEGVLVIDAESIVIERP